MASNRWLYGDTWASPPPKPVYIGGNLYRLFSVGGDYKFIGVLEYSDGTQDEFPAQSAGEAFRAACLAVGV